MSHSNVVVLSQPTELQRRSIRLSEASPSIQRAVVYWADLIDQDSTGSILKLVERAPLLTDSSLLYERREPFTRLRFTGAAVTSLHRSVADSLLNDPLPSRPIARRHDLAVMSGCRTICSLMLPFGMYLVAMFED
jgi:hypothetical protein